jgi:two-component system KDP operon response regulator KdpE
VATPALVLVVDDDPAILKLVRLELLDQGFRVVTAETGAQGLELAEEHRPDLVVLDLRLPDVSGFEVMRTLRLRSSIPILLLTVHASDTEKVRGLELGADDYLGKPFSPDELVARVKAVLRRVHRTLGEESTVCLRDVSIDLARRTVTRQGELVRLTRTEWNLLQALAENAGRVMLSAEILTKVWGPEYRDDTQYLRVWISRIRAKLEPDRPDDSLIRTFPGIGYMLEAPPDTRPAPATTAPAIPNLTPTLPADDPPTDPDRSYPPPHTRVPLTRVPPSDRR